MTLREKQSEFVRMVARLIDHATSLGYELTFGDAYRDARCSYGSETSLHKIRLAVDFNLFKDGVWLQGDKGHSELHDFWDSIGGAKRIPGDSNHYSLEHEGMR